MLPDYPILKERILKKIILTRYMFIREHGMEPFKDIESRQLYEGDKVDSGGGTPMTGKRELDAIRSEFAFEEGEVDTMTPEQMLQRLDAVSLDMVRQQSDMFIRFMSATSAEVGGIIDGNGRPLNPDTFFEAIERLDLDFDENGKPSGLKIVVTGPNATKEAPDLLEALSSNPEYSARYDALMEKKRMEWRDRESTRKLAG